jgi:hypothetical protein
MCGGPATCFGLFGHLQGGIQQRKLKKWPVMSQMQELKYKHLNGTKLKNRSTECVTCQLSFEFQKIAVTYLHYQGYVPVSPVGVHSPMITVDGTYP